MSDQDDKRAVFDDPEINGTVPGDKRTVEDLKSYVNALLAMTRRAFGERSECVIMIGIPLAGGHDRFAAQFYGPCLSARGLLAWGTEAVSNLIDAGDTSKNGKPHP